MTFAELNDLFCDGETHTSTEKIHAKPSLALAMLFLLPSITPMTRRCVNLPLMLIIISAHCIMMLMNTFGRKHQSLWSDTESALNVCEI